MAAGSPLNTTVERSIGLIGATGVGIGGIVGGGLLALAGTAFVVSGPSAILAFALNGVIAVITALSFAEMSTRFPESGGTYTFARKVLSVEAAFLVGWVVWFASIVAAVLYALGFAAFTIPVIEAVWSSLIGTPPDWITSRYLVICLAAIATVAYTINLMFKTGGGGQWINLAKIIVFAILLAAGLVALSKRSPDEIVSNLTPFFTGGTIGLISAMGFTFIALQGFDLIAAVAGEVREPRKNIPRAMLLSLGAAILIYIPLLFILTAVGIEPGESIAEASKGREETIVAIAVQNYLGTFGYWFVIIAAILSMLSALQANLFAASRVAFAMARDRNLPKRLGRINPKRGTPVMAVAVTSLTVIIILSVVGDVSAAGAAASLIFLVSFALTHWTAILARVRGDGERIAFKTPWFPFFPVVGALACISLAVFQGFAVLSAGAIALAWLGIGSILYLFLFARRAQVVDASSEAFDPQLARLRGRNPLVLVPIANPYHAAAMVTVANAITPPYVGRVLLLSVVVQSMDSDEENQRKLSSAQMVLGKALSEAMEIGLYPEAMTTIAPQPWPEITRVAKTHKCECLLVGLSIHEETIEGKSLERMIGSAECDVVVLRAPDNWLMRNAKRILVPIAGMGGHDMLRARLIGSFLRMREREITYLRIVPEGTSQQRIDIVKRGLMQFTQDEVPGKCETKIITANNIATSIATEAADYDLVILGLQRVSKRHKFFGNVALTISRNTDCALIMISRRG